MPEMPCSLSARFLSTPSARRATYARGREVTKTAYFYPRPPRGGRLLKRAQAELDSLFLSTPSARRATPQRYPLLRAYFISIHALREEGDSAFGKSQDHPADFYPRPPRGGRRRRSAAQRPRRRISIHALREEGDCFINNNELVIFLFLSTPSARRATVLSDF